MGCDRCGTETTRNALTAEAPQDMGQNGVVWLCDNCIREFGGWLDSG